MLLSVFSFILISCGKDEVEPEAEILRSLKMIYDGVTYTGVEQNSMVLGLGIIAAAGTTGDRFLLTVIGIGADGTTTHICPDPRTCNNLCALTLDFGAAIVKEGFIATS